VEGQVVISRTVLGKGEEAQFSPAASGDYRFGGAQDGAFELVAARLTGTGDVVCDIGGEKTIHVDSDGQGRFEIKLPDFEVNYNDDTPYTLTSTGNIKLAKVFSGASNLEGYAHKDIWQYTADGGGWLDGTMVFGYKMPELKPGEAGKGPAYSFPFCSASAQYWLEHLPPPEPESGRPEPAPGGRTGYAYPFILIPAALAFLAGFALSRRVCVSIVPGEEPGSVVVVRDRRGPAKVAVDVDHGGLAWRSFVLGRGESVCLPFLPLPGPGVIKVKTPGRWNISKQKRVNINA
jgi:hypothetical protein